MDKPKKVEDVWPHTETVLFLMDSNTCFGNPVSNVMDEISNCVHLEDRGRHKDNDLSADCLRFDRSRIEDINELIPNSLLFIHCDLIIETDLWVYLKGTSIPKSSEVVVLLDDSAHADAEEQIDNLPRPLETASCKDDVLEEAERYFKTICPQCKGDPAKKWVLEWSQVVYEKVHN